MGLLLPADLVYRALKSAYEKQQDTRQFLEGMEDTGDLRVRPYRAAMLNYFIALGSISTAEARPRPDAMGVSRRLAMTYR